MTVERVSGPDDPRVALYRDIGDGELLRDRGVFVAEGRLVVRRVIEDGRYRVRSCLVNDAALRALDADFLDRGPANVRYTADYAQRRDVVDSAPKTELNRKIGRAHV